MYFMFIYKIIYENLLYFFSMLLDKKKYLTLIVKSDLFLKHNAYPGPSQSFGGYINFNICNKALKFIRKPSSLKEALLFSKFKQTEHIYLKQHHLLEKRVTLKSICFSPICK